MANGFVQNVKSLWSAWKRLAHKIGNFQARVLLTILYAVVVLPFGVGRAAVFRPDENQTSSHGMDRHAA